MARGIERRPLFCDDHDRTALLSRLGRLVHVTASPLYAWTLLATHVLCVAAHSGSGQGRWSER
jgi:hypothetical protein